MSGAPRRISPTDCVSSLRRRQKRLRLIAQAVEAERHCCRFLRFRMAVEPDGEAVFLELTGPAGNRDFVSALIEG